LGDDELRLDFIRTAIRRELRRRESRQIQRHGSLSEVNVD
jgi:hypothetical protein